jgi:chromosome segregation ATPase
MGTVTTGDEGRQTARSMREVELLTASFLTLQDRCDALTAQLFDERSRRLHDLTDLDALGGALAENRASTAEIHRRHVECEQRIVELESQLRATQVDLEQLHEALAASAWSPQLLRLRTQWRRLPGWLRRSVHVLLDRVGRLRDWSR